MGVIPSFLNSGDGRQFYDGNAFGNTRLRMGEVQKIVLPNDPDSFSKQVTEYSVLVNHLENGTQVTKMYDYCTVSNLFGSQADYFNHTLRAANTSSVGLQNKLPGSGTGSKVLILCINGSHHQGIIIGAIPDGNAPIDPELGHHISFMFNGVEVKINDAGELTLNVHGKTDNLGATAAEVGTTVSITKDGTVEVKTKDNDVTIDQPNGNVVVTAKNTVIVNSPKIQLGSNQASQPAILGNIWYSIMNDLLQAILAMNVYTPDGPSSPPINSPQFAAVQARLQSALSGITYHG